MTHGHQSDGSDPEDFSSHVADAYAHLYELVYLRDHPLAEMLVPASVTSPQMRARRLHEALLKAISDLDPGLRAPPLSRAWRSHRMMSMRYTECLSPRTVADQLGVSVRHYYRLHRIAIEDVCKILLDQIALNRSPADQVDQSVVEAQSISHLQLLRQEATRMAQASRYARVGDTVEGVIHLLKQLMEDVEVGVRLELAESLPRVRVDPSLLRQVFMVVFGYLVGNTERATICVAGHLLESEVHVSISVEPHEGVHSSDSQAAQELLVELRELSALADLQICPRRAGCCVGGFDLRLPAAERIVLVVDDNADMLQLFEGFLFRHNYRVVTASAAEEVLTLARQFQPYAITLDLMMAGRDGWDLLQQIRNEPDTHHIPIIVCTVLRQKELSLSLGASAYLQKPVTEHELLTALESLDNP